MKKKSINLIIVTLKITHKIILIDNSKTFYTDNNVLKLNFLFLHVNLCENLLIYLCRSKFVFLSIYF